jgi:hypothetical protein
MKRKAEYERDEAGARRARGTEGLVGYALYCAIAPVMGNEDAERDYIDMLNEGYYDK